jgi:hypothetical protein
MAGLILDDIPEPKCDKAHLCPPASTLIDSKKESYEYRQT